MRFLLLFLLTTPAFAQIDTGDGSDGACTHTTISAGGTFNCTTLTIGTTPSFTPGTPALIIKVQGDVQINALINLDGGNGSNQTASNVNGGDGGPGAGNGGGADFGGTTQPGSDASPSSGTAAASSGTCGGGGGGGGMFVAGIDGADCPSGGTGALGGTSAVPSEFNFPTLFRGGFGGGAGGDSGAAEIGTGGGGGGAIHITAGGDVTIAANISARGGNGGTNGNDGGGGGAGSGGVIWIQAVGNIINNASLNADGGTGGNGGAGGNGGNGGRGAVRLEDIDGAISGSGSAPGYTDLVATGSAPASGSASLESGISCGMVKPKNNSLTLTILVGFALSFLLRSFLKFFPQSYRKS